MMVLMRNCTGYLLLALLGICLLAFPSLAATLELHHALGEADQDGHQHSAADLCSWVQSHTSSSVVGDRKSTRLNSSHSQISYAVFCLKKKNNESATIHD